MLRDDDTVDLHHSDADVEELPIIVRADSVEIRNLEIQSREVAMLFAEAPVAQWQPVATSAMDIGARCLKLAGEARDVEGLRRDLESAVHDVERALGQVPEAVERRLTEKLGVEDGQVLAPVRGLVQEASAVSSVRLSEVKSLLANDLDPERESSKLGSALKNLGALLDPNRKDSVQGRIEAAVAGITTVDGELVKAVRRAVAEVVEPLTRELDRLALEVRGQEAAAEIVDKTTAKGLPYEERVLEVLQGWAAAAGAQVEHVGPDNKPGDILVTVTPIGGAEIRIVIEARDRTTPLGRKAVAESLARAIAQRDAAAGIYLSATSAGLGKEIGDWAEGETTGGPFAAATHEHVVTAVRFVAAQVQLAEAKRERAELDSAALERQLERIRTAVGRVAVINRKLSEIQDIAAAAKGYAETLRDEVRASLVDMEDALRRPASDTPERAG